MPVRCTAPSGGDLTPLWPGLCGRGCSSRGALATAMVEPWPAVPCWEGGRQILLARNGNRKMFKILLANVYGDSYFEKVKVEPVSHRTWAIGPGFSKSAFPLFYPLCEQPWTCRRCGSLSRLSKMSSALGARWVTGDEEVSPLAAKSSPKGSTLHTGGGQGTWTGCPPPATRQPLLSLQNNFLVLADCISGVEV